MSEIFRSDDPECNGEDVDHGADTARIREANDRFRQTLQGGVVLYTAGVNAFPMPMKDRIMTAIRSFDAFTPDCDPHGEHDFGEVVVEGERVWWKIDLYDHSMQYGSPDPADDRVTRRVMTVMKSSEY